MTSDASQMPIPADDSLQMSSTFDTEPQSLMGVRFACNALENAMPMIMQEVKFVFQNVPLALSYDNARGTF